MSGNSTRLAVGLATFSPVWLLALALILAFVAGAMVGTYVATRAGRLRKPAVLSLVLLLLTVAATLEALHGDRAVVFLLASAMGAENAVFLRDGEVSIGVTYMTGALVKLSQCGHGRIDGWRALRMAPLSAALVRSGRWRGDRREPLYTLRPSQPVGARPPQPRFLHYTPPTSVAPTNGDRFERAHERSFRR